MSDEGTINLRDEPEKEEAEFKIEHVHEKSENAVSSTSASYVNEVEDAAMRPHDKVKLKFDKFVNLVASHAYEEIFEKHADEDVVISTGLLADLANAHEEKPDRKVPMIFLVGIILGVGITWFILKS